MQQGFDFDVPCVDRNTYSDVLLEQQKVRYSDIKLAKLIAGDSDSLYFLCLLLLVAERAQHTCLHLGSVNWNNPFNVKESVLAEGIPATPFISEVDMETLQQTHPAFAVGGPLQFFAGRLYLTRYAEYEKVLANRFSAMVERQSKVDEDALRELLEYYFPSQQGEINWQKVACANAAVNGFSIITGGPGTGKTTTVTKLLAILQSLNSQAPLTIKLVAPTGKAAARLSESIKTAKVKLELPLALSALIPAEGQTIHRLLGVVPFSNKFRYTQDNPLHLDVLIVDEASMVDLGLMAKLVNALPHHATLILLGDKDQLASVDTGCVLGDLCQTLKLGEIPAYSEQHRARLSTLCNAEIPATERHLTYRLADALAFLQKSHRFDAKSGIGQLALAVNNNDQKHLNRVLEAGYSDIEFYSLDGDSYKNMLSRAAQAYSHYLTELAKGSAAKPIHDAFANYRLLTAVREGHYGANELNRRIELSLSQQGLIDLTRRFYLGMPIMITANDYQLKLFNGDIGILMLDEQGELKAAFVNDAGETRYIYPARLPQFELAYVMTIHKSQGSEFAHTAMILPPLQKAQQGVNRQLVYTGITRAKTKIELIAQKEVITLAMRKPIERSSGLYQRLVETK